MTGAVPGSLPGVPIHSAPHVGALGLEDVRRAVVVAVRGQPPATLEDQGPLAGGELLERLPRRPHDEDVPWRLVRDPIWNRAEHEPLRPGHTLVPDDEEVRVLLRGGGADAIRGVAPQRHRLDPPSAEALRR